MYEVAKRSAAFAAATGGLLLVGVGCASAESIVQTTAGAARATAVSLTGLDAAMAKTGGVVSGNNIAAPLNLPINLCGIAILGGIVDQSCSTGTAPSASASAMSASTASAALGMLSGNVVQAPLNLPVDLHDIAVLGAVADADDCSCSAAGIPATGADAVPAAAGTGRSTTTKQTSNTLAAAPSNNQSRPYVAEVAPVAQKTVAQVAQAAQDTVAQVAQVAQAAQKPIAQVAQKTVAQVAQAAQKPLTQVAATSTAMSSIAMDLPASVPMQGPAAEPKAGSAVKQILLPVAASGGHLAETGVNVAPPLCAGGAALASGATLSALAYKAKGGTEQH
jgi:hypothetical protein